MDKKILSDVFENMIQHGVVQTIELYRRICEAGGFNEFDDHESFYFSVIYPFEQFTDGMIRAEVSNNDDVVFILKNQQFIESHFQELIKTYEGFACCADKSRTIIEVLLRFFMTGNEIKFNLDGEYTFHLPKIVFRDHESIIQFYNALKGLFYGKNKRYIEVLSDIIKKNQASDGGFAGHGVIE